jgi:putative Holliday junction resolvase
MSGSVSRTGRVIGLDIGTRRIGVATSDELGLIAAPTRVLVVSQSPNGEGDAIASITALVRETGATRVVAGVPRNMKGEHGVQAEWTEQFVQQLREALRAIHIPIALIDERWSTTLAERFDHERPDWLLDAQWGKVRDRRDARDQVNRRSHKRSDNRDAIDARAAAVILQGYLDRQRARAARDFDVRDRGS